MKVEKASEYILIHSIYSNPSFLFVIFFVVVFQMAACPDCDKPLGEDYEKFTCGIHMLCRRCFLLFCGEENEDPDENLHDRDCYGIPNSVANGKSHFLTINVVRTLSLHSFTLFVAVEIASGLALTLVRYNRIKTKLTGELSQNILPISEIGLDNLVNVLKKQQFIDRSHMIYLICEVSKLLVKETNILTLTSSKVVVVGDIHGQFYDLLNIIELIHFKDPLVKILFMGDYVDRGAFGVETLATLMYLKLLYPQR
jgi:hypothetical protein